MRDWRSSRPLADEGQWHLSVIWDTSQPSSTSGFGLPVQCVQMCVWACLSSEYCKQHTLTEESKRFITENCKFSYFTFTFSNHVCADAHVLPSVALPGICDHQLPSTNLREKRRRRRWEANYGEDKQQYYSQRDTWGLRLTQTNREQHSSVITKHFWMSGSIFLPRSHYSSGMKCAHKHIMVWCLRGFFSRSLCLER